MPNDVLRFLRRHSSLVVTTHDPADADGLGAEKVFFQFAGSMGKKVRIVNSGPIPENFRFMDSEHTIEIWKDVSKTLDRESALVVLDTADEYNIGELRDLIPYVPEVFVIDHHEPNKFSSLCGLIDNSASSTSELLVELAAAAGVALSPECAAAAYAGIVYDTGFFAYSKTSGRTFRAALALVEAGISPYKIYRELNESASTRALMLQKAVFATLEIHNRGRVAVQVLRKGDLENTGAFYEDAENFINIPLRSRDIQVSLMVKENREGNVRCSLRSKGGVNVSKIAQAMGGGGHVTAAGFRSSMGLDETLDFMLEKINETLDNT
jgi:phosphoesterase RecJ-like protein